MKTSNTKILVISDLKNNPENLLRSAISIAKKMNAALHFFGIKSPSEVVSFDNQLSAMRSLNRDQITIDKELREKFRGLQKKHGLSFDYSFAIGNEKDEVGKCIDLLEPHIVVLEKKPTRVFSLKRDVLIDYVLEKHQGAVMIASPTHSLSPQKSITLGFLNTDTHVVDTALVKELIGDDAAPIRKFTVAEKGTAQQQTHTSSASNKEVIEYVFENNDTSLENVALYLQKNNVDLLWLHRTNNKHISASHIQAAINNVANKTNVSILVTA